MPAHLAWRKRGRCSPTYVQALCSCYDVLIFFADRNRTSILLRTVPHPTHNPHVCRGTKTLRTVRNLLRATHKLFKLCPPNGACCQFTGGAVLETASKVPAQGWTRGVSGMKLQTCFGQDRGRPSRKVQFGAAVKEFWRCDCIPSITGVSFT